MSNDLIKRMDVIENIWSLFNNTYNDATRFDAEETELAKRILSDVQTVLEKQPTAYDVDKVVGQLENEKQTSASARAEAIIGMCGASANHYSGEECAYEKAIEIVKSCGIE